MSLPHPLLLPVTLRLSVFEGKPKLPHKKPPRLYKVFCSVPCPSDPQVHLSHRRSSSTRTAGGRVLAHVRELWTKDSPVTDPRRQSCYVNRRRYWVSTTSLVTTLMLTKRHTAAQVPVNHPRLQSPVVPHDRNVCPFHDYSTTDFGLSATWDGTGPRRDTTSYCAR